MPVAVERCSMFRAIMYQAHYNPHNYPPWTENADDEVEKMVRATFLDNGIVNHSLEIKHNY